jgi:FlaA1/EpsC-like NDP-sugar epimerase
VVEITQNTHLVPTFQGKKVLVTGACGTIGKALVARLLQCGVERVIGLDINESELFFVNEEFKNFGFEAVLGDVRDLDSLLEPFKKADIVFHTAALKHVPLCEHNPMEAVKTNIHGVQNVIHAARICEVERVVYTSSDKAVNPPNVMGTTKLMGEKLINAANIQDPDGGCIFSTTRFGNVLGSRGSVLPVFKSQIQQGGPVRLTDPEMTRFIMTLDEAVDLVVNAAHLARGGEVFITKMGTIKISDLARVMIDSLAENAGFDPEKMEIEEIGRRPGEKIYEELMNEEEVRRSIELEKYFVVRPALSDLYGDAAYKYDGIISESVDRPYNSQTEEAMKESDLRDYLKFHSLL